MKKMMLWSALSAVALTSCNKKPEAEVAPPAPEPVAMQTPEPVPFAPSGVFFLVSKVSLETDSGVLSYPAGSKLFKLGNRYVSGDGHQLTLRAEQVTNDLRIAEQVAGRDPKLQAAIQESIRIARTASSTTPVPPKPPRPPSATGLKAGAAPPASPRPNLDGDQRKEDRSRQNRN